MQFVPITTSDVVALRKESVDRNGKPTLKRGGYAVALRKESVDRNLNIAEKVLTSMWSLSARRAWIEIVSDSLPALMLTGRSPQGERG